MVAHSSTNHSSVKLDLKLEMWPVNALRLEWCYDTGNDKNIFTSVGLVDLLNHPGHHGVYTISFHLFLRPNYCPHWEHMDCLV